MALSKEEIIDSIGEMSVMDLVDLVAGIEEKFGVSAAAVAAPAAAPAAGGGDAAAGDAEQTEFEVVLASPGGAKIAVIKVVREITGLGLKEAKDLVDGAPKGVKAGLSKEEAEEIAQKITDAGGTAELK